MPKIEVRDESLYRYLGRNVADPELEALLVSAKGELDGRDGDTLKLELNDTNRPDLWSAAGVGRCLRAHETGTVPNYPFFSTAGDSRTTDNREVVVDPGLAQTRPYICAFAVRGPALDDDQLVELIQSQEKLAWNFGRKRKAVAIGLYRSDLIRYPVHYDAVDPDSTRFVPLGVDREMSLREIITDHPKGRDFGDIVAQMPKMPFLRDDKGDVLSFPPVINSAHVGAVQVGDTELFVEMTGTDLHVLCLAASVFACDFADAGFDVLPVLVRYPYETSLGRDVVTPFRFQSPVTARTGEVNRFLGVKLTDDEIVTALRRAGIDASISAGEIRFDPPPYRNDFLHPVDVVEEVVIGRGMDTFEPQMPQDFTVGRLSPQEEVNREVKDLLVGLSFQEMVYSYLGSHRDFVARMLPADASFADRTPAGEATGEDRYVPSAAGHVRIANPMSENYEYVRSSSLPFLLATEQESGNAAYPHRIFEIGKVAVPDARRNEGSRTYDLLGALIADGSAGFNDVVSIVAVLAYYLGMTYRLAERDDARFIPGRCATVVVGSRSVGTIGEVHPGVLANWSIEVPCAAIELDLTAILESRAASGDDANRGVTKTSAKSRG